MMAAELAATAAASFFRLDAHRGREKRGEMEGWRAVDVVAAFRRSRPDRWAHGRRTGAMACPHGGHGLRPVGHFQPPPVRFELQHLQQCVATLQHCETKKNSSTLSVLYLMIQAESRGEPIDKVGA
jgi:hypothetical protein